MEAVVSFFPLVSRIRFLFLIPFVLCLESNAQPTANNDFYVVDSPQYLWTFVNDENYGGHAWVKVGGPAYSYVNAPCGGPGNGDPTCVYITPPTSIGFSYYTYKYTPCCGSPPGPDSNIGIVFLLFIPKDDAQNAGYSCPIVGQPVNVTNGNMWLRQLDYSLPGRGEEIEINRFYNSIIQSSGHFGFGWSTKFDESIVRYGDNMIRLNQADGKAAYFGRMELTDPFTSFSPGVAGQIVQNTDGTFTLTYKDGSTRVFSSTGRLISLADRNGNTTSLTYDVNNRLIGVTDASGRSLTLTPNASGNIVQISDSTGVVSDYEYFPSTSLLKTVTYQDGSKFKFEYVNKIIDGQTRTYLATVKDALDNVLETHEYDSQGRATTSERHGGAEKYTFAYTTDPLNFPLTVVTDALGRVTKYTHIRVYGTNIVRKIDGQCGCGAGGSETTQNEFNYGNSWLNLTKRIDALGRETVYTYDSDRNVVQETDVFGTQQWTYDSFGQVLTYKDRIDSGGTNNTAVLTYDSTGNLKTYTDALGKVTTLEYPKTNNVGLPVSIKDARNNVTKFKWFASGLLDEIEDPYLKKTKFTYDARGRTKTVTNALNHVTTYNYFDDTNRKVEMLYPNADKVTYKYDIRRLLESVTDERGKVTGYEFDPQYRLKKITDPLGHFKEFGYDLMSNMTSYTDGLGNVTNYEYNDFDRLKKIVHPAAVSGGTRLEEEFEYDKTGRIRKYFDTADRLTEYTYNDTTRTNTVKNAENEITTIKYNQRFQTFEVKDAINQTYTFSYDPLGRLLSQTRAGGTMSFEYDNVGNRKKRTDYAGRVTNYFYDNLNRLTKIEYEPGGTGNDVDKPQSTYAYDYISRLTSAVNDVGTVAFTYDNRNRVLSTTDVFGKVIAYEYERTPTVNQKRIKLDGTNYAAYNYDDAGRLANIVNSSDSTTTTFGYDNADRLTSRVFPNGVTTTYEYYNNGLLKRLKDSTTSATLFDRQYTYNSANQIGQIAELTQTRNFTYDNVDRLTGMTNGTTTESYAYDDVGNRTSSHLSATYGYQSGEFNQLSSNASATMRYDANGNTIQKSEGSKFWRYTWDYENRLTEASTRKEKVRYRYDALGRRVERNLNSGKDRTKYTLDGLDVLVDNDDGTLTKYLNGPGIDNKLRAETGSAVNYFLADHLGSTNGLADASGNVTSTASYDSFGNKTGNLATRYQFTGREYDNFSGQYFYRARFYDSGLGRFTSEDPIGFAGGDINLYGYVWNNPLHFTDPSGKAAPAAAAYAIFEFCATGYDVYDFYSSLSDPNSDWIDIGLGGGGLAAGAILPGSGYGKLGKGIRKYFGRRGSPETRDQLDEIRDQLLDNNPDYRHVGGGRDRLTGKDIREEYIPNINGGRKASSYPDLTFEGPDGSRIRINTYDANKDGLPSMREADAADRLSRNSGGAPVILIPKRKCIPCKE